MKFNDFDLEKGNSFFDLESNKFSIIHKMNEANGIIIG